MLQGPAITTATARPVSDLLNKDEHFPAGPNLWDTHRTQHRYIDDKPVYGWMPISCSTPIDEMKQRTHVPGVALVVVPQGSRVAAHYHFPVHWYADLASVNSLWFSKHSSQLLTNKGIFKCVARRYSPVKTGSHSLRVPKNKYELDGNTVRGTVNVEEEDAVRERKRETHPEHQPVDDSQYLSYKPSVMLGRAYRPNGVLGYGVEFYGSAQEAFRQTTGETVTTAPADADKLAVLSARDWIKARSKWLSTAEGTVDPYTPIEQPHAQ